jgi:transcriptional regulator with XRE-family HTH domain
MLLAELPMPDKSVTPSIPEETPGQMVQRLANYASLRDIEELTGVSHTYLNKIIQRNHRPSYDVLEKIADGLKLGRVDEVELFSRYGYKPRSYGVGWDARLALIQNWLAVATANGWEVMPLLSEWDYESVSSPADVDRVVEKMAAIMRERQQSGLSSELFPSRSNAELAQEARELAEEIAQRAAREAIREESRAHETINAVDHLIAGWRLRVNANPDVEIPFPQLHGGVRGLTLEDAKSILAEIDDTLRRGRFPSRTKAKDAQ